MFESDAAGWVYFLDDQQGHIKIGKAKVLDQRIYQLKTQFPFPVKLVAAIQTSDRHSLETYLHQKFAEQRLNGEWFGEIEGARGTSHSVANYVWEHYLIEIDYEVHTSFRQHNLYLVKDDGTLESVWDFDAGSLFMKFETVCLDLACELLGVNASHNALMLLAPLRQQTEMRLQDEEASFWKETIDESGEVSHDNVAWSESLNEVAEVSSYVN